ncbi:MAG TPA: diacylglycerol kinase family protein [Gaiellaceae bacterium]|jgi:diacylglycerol kinase family enzyme
MKVTLIVNPFATRVTEERVRALEERLPVVETLLTERRGHATELAARATGDAVFVYGGDGLVNEAVNGLPPGKPLGIVAGGHTNVLARSLGVPGDPAQAVRERRISLGRVNGRRFSFAAGMGVDSETVRELETRKREQDGRRRGDLGYARVAARLLVRGYEPRLEIEGLGRAGMLFVSNDAVFTYAGPRPFRFSPEARFELGLDVVAPGRAGAAQAMRFVARLLAGRGLAGLPGVLSAHDVDVVRVRCDEPLPLQADGEDLGDVAEAFFEAERDAISVLVGAEQELPSPP